jgi:hypothetical protein
MNLFIINKLTELTLMFQDIANICGGHEVPECNLEQKINIDDDQTKFTLRIWVDDKYLELLFSSDSDGIDYIAKREDAPAFFVHSYDDMLNVIKTYRNEIVGMILDRCSLPVVEDEYEGINSNEILREWV